MSPRRKRQVVAALAGALVSLPYAFFLSVLGYPNATFKFVAFLTLPPLVVAILSAAVFDIVAFRVKQTPLALIVAGWISATITGTTLVALYTLLDPQARHGSWIKFFVSYESIALMMFWPVVVFGGGLVGWIASTKRFAL
jgi:hypothetical protein